MVGSLVVYESKIIGEGYHREYGGPHAEVNAINSVKDKKLLKKSTLYVNLEPCSHYGKTPPCSILIKEIGIPHVVISMKDPNPLVSGKGISILSDSGVRITTGVLEKEAARLNRRYLINISSKRPYIILKWAESQDGYIDLVRKDGDPVQPNWITNQTARMLVHKWRAEESAILAGVNTVLTDNPSLNVRNWSGPDPIRIIIDRFNRVPGNFSVKNDRITTWIFTTQKLTDNTKNTSYFNIQKDYRLAEILEILVEKGVSSMIVEGGAKMIGSFIRENLWDEARVFKGSKNFYEGIKAPNIGKQSEISESFRNNKLSIWYNDEC
jgi:diaminohydroxyphosphoribosylaminopyrimidine deaminase/5-amino-6-(5-phosphoribosylamino)uracil reductase